MPRAFVALVPPPAVLDSIDEAERRLRTEIAALLGGRPRGEPVMGSSGVQWTPRAQRHLTVAFLGDSVDLDDATARLDRLAAQGYEPCAVGLCGIGVFPRPRAARVLWCGVGPGRADLESLMRAAAQTFAVTPEWPPTPHVTLARLRRPTDLSAIVTRDWRAPTWTADELLLVESLASAGGREHRIAHRCSLLGPSR